MLLRSDRVSRSGGVRGGGGTIVEPPLVRSVTVEPQSVLIVVGGQPRPLIASTDAGGGAPTSVSWSSSDPSVAQVVANGQAATVAGMKPGTAWIVAAATADASKRDSARVSVTAGTLATLTVSAPVTSVVAFSRPLLLPSVADFVAFVNRPTLKQRLQKAEEEFKAGKGIDWRKVRDDV